MLIDPNSRLEKKNKATMTGFYLCIILYCDPFTHIRYAFNPLSSRCHKWVTIRWHLGLHLQVLPWDAAKILLIFVVRGKN